MDTVGEGEERGMCGIEDRDEANAAGGSIQGVSPSYLRSKGDLHLSLRSFANHAELVPPWYQC
jgi:hypothetical protein